MIPGLNQRKVQQMMKQMGIQQVEVDAVSVVIRTPEKELFFESPQVSKVNMMGQETYQVVGSPTIRELSTFEVSEEDIATVVDQTDASEEDARKALEETEGDIAGAILKLK